MLQRSSRAAADFDTASCSGTQIIEERCLGFGHAKFGISKGALENWIARVKGG